MISGFALAASLSCPPLHAQSAARLQSRVGELKESMARNKEALSQYTWEETVKIILKGEQKKTEQDRLPAERVERLMSIPGIEPPNPSVDRIRSRAERIAAA